MGKGVGWVLAAAAAAMAAATALSQNPDLTGHRVHRLPGRVPQDGWVETNQADRFVVDNCQIQGEPPFEVLRIVKQFYPPPGFRFDIFRAGERDEARIAQALSNRYCLAFSPDNWEWSFWERRPDYVDVWFDPEDLLAWPWFGETPWEAKTVYEANAAEGPNAILVTALLAHSQKAAHFPLRCDGNLAPTNRAGGAGIVQGHHWQAMVAGGIDLDVDSDNTAAAPSFAPERTSWEDAIESGCATNLGRLVVCSSGDSDLDGVADYADLQHSNRFAVAILDVSNVTETIDWPTAKARFTYSASDPRGQSPTNPPAPGLLRLWTRDGTQLRAARSVADGGSWIPSGVEFPARLVLSNGVRVATLYMEGVNADPAADRLVKAEFAPCAGAPYLADQVQVTVLKVDLLVNDTEAETDDYLVKEKASGVRTTPTDTPAGATDNHIPMKVRLLGPAAFSCKVKLSDSGGGDVTIKKTDGSAYPADGETVTVGTDLEVNLFGVSPSTALNDVTVTAKTDKTGDGICGQEDLTVLWCDNVTFRGSDCQGQANWKGDILGLIDENLTGSATFRNSMEMLFTISPNVVIPDVSWDIKREKRVHDWKDNVTDPPLYDDWTDDDSVNTDEDLTQSSGDTVLKVRDLPAWQDVGTQAGTRTRKHSMREWLEVSIGGKWYVSSTYQHWHSIIHARNNSSTNTLWFRTNVNEILTGEISGTASTWPEN